MENHKQLWIIIVALIIGEVVLFTLYFNSLQRHTMMSGNMMSRGAMMGQTMTPGDGKNGRTMMDDQLMDNMLDMHAMMGQMMMNQMDAMKNPADRQKMMNMMKQNKDMMKKMETTMGNPTKSMDDNRNKR